MNYLHPSRILDGLEWAMKVVAAACLIGMALVTGWDVVGDAVFNTPLYGAEEIVSILAVLAVGFSLPYAHSQQSHIGVEIFTNRLSSRTQARIKLVTDFAGCLLFAVVAWQMFRYGASMQRSGKVSMNLELPTYYVVHTLAIGFSVFSLCLMRSVFRFFVKHQEDKS